MEESAHGRRESEKEPSKEVDRQHGEARETAGEADVRRIWDFGPDEGSHPFHHLDPWEPR